MYVDVAQVPDRPDTFVAVVIRAANGDTINACSLRAPSATQAEEAAIALALRSDHNITTVLSDSRSAIASFARCDIGETAARILPTLKTTTTTIRWFPAHVGPIRGGTANRNERADAVARELAHRAAPPCPPNADGTVPHAEPLTEYGDILAWHREERRTLPPPHGKLDRREGVLLRQLQTRTVLTPALARYVCPDLFVSDQCSMCAKGTATLAHIMWGCSVIQDDTVQDSLPPDIVAHISSSDSEAQLMAVQRLGDALARQVRTGDPPPPSGGKRSRQVANAGTLA